MALHKMTLNQVGNRSFGCVFERDVMFNVENQEPTHRDQRGEHQQPI